MMETSSLRKADIVKKLMETLGVKYRDAVAFYDSFLHEIKEALIEEKSVKITSFASFIVRQKKGRKGRNPKTLVPAVITPRKVILFHPSEYLRDLVIDKMKKDNS